MADQIYSCALKLLSRREHSEQELKQKLLLRKFDPKEINETLKKLIENRYLSDERYTEAYIRMRKQKGYGPVRIRLELKEKGISSDLIDHYVIFDDEDWIDLLQQVREKHFGEVKPLSFEEKIKQAQFLQRRGFTREQIKFS